MRSEIKRSMLRSGMTVEVSVRGDTSSSATGKISEILTNRETHPYGILVTLTDGIQGRVTALLDSQCTIVEREETSSSKSDAFLGLEQVLEQGEGPRVEFKESLLWSSRMSQGDIQKGGGDLKRYGTATSRVMVARALAGFLNSRGGQLLIGVKENKNNQCDELVGVNIDYIDIKDKCEDGYRRAIVDRVIEPYFPSFIMHDMEKYFSISFPKTSGKTLCLIDVRASDRKVYLRISKDEHFFIRVEASTREIRGEEVVDYCMERFPNSR